MLLAVIAITTAGVLPVFLFGGLAVQISEDLNLSAAAKGQIVFGYFGASALTSAVSGRTTERFGPRPMLRLAALLGAASAGGIAAAPSFGWLVAAATIGGLANAVAQPAANALVVHSIDRRRQGFALGIKQAAIPMATLLAGLAVPSIGLTIGWRWAFVGGAVLAAVAVLAPPPVPGTLSSSRRVHRKAPSTIGPRAPLVTLAVGAGLGSAMANALGAFTTSSAVAAGIGAGAAGALLAAGSALGLTLRIASGWMADRRGNRHLTAVAMMLVGGALGLLCMATQQPGIVVIGTLVAFGSGWSWPGVLNLAIVSHYPTAPAAATGLTQTGAYTGGAIGPLLMGFMVEEWGYGASWTAFSLVALAAAAVMAIARALLRAERQSVNAATNASA